MENSQRKCFCKKRKEKNEIKRFQWTVLLVFTVWKKISSLIFNCIKYWIMVNSQSAAETIFFPNVRIIVKYHEPSSLARANTVAKEKLHI